MSSATGSTLEANAAKAEKYLERGDRDVVGSALSYVRQHGVVDRRARLERCSRRGRLRLAVDEVLYSGARITRRILLRFREVRVERAGRFAHALLPRFFTYSCKLFFLKFSTGCIS